MRHLLLRTALLIVATVTPLCAQQNLTLDPARSEVHVTLADSLHVIHGVFTLQKGEIAFDSATGKVSGSLLVDALSGKSGNPIRDHRMVNDELKAPTFKTIAFTPTRFTGTYNSTGDSALHVYGTFTLLGTPHEIELPMQIQVNGNQFHAVGSFSVPYVQWGLTDPSNFMIHVKKEIQVDLSLVGILRH